MSFIVFYKKNTFNVKLFQFFVLLLNQVPFFTSITVNINFKESNSVLFTFNCFLVTTFTFFVLCCCFFNYPRNSKKVVLCMLFFLALGFMFTQTITYKISAVSERKKETSLFFSLFFKFSNSNTISTNISIIYIIIFSHSIRSLIATKTTKIES